MTNVTCAKKWELCDFFGVPPLNWHRPAFAEARPQPYAELLREPVELLQVWLHRRRALHGREDRRVPLQCAAQRREVAAEAVQRTAAPVLDLSVPPRVPPHGTEECRRHGLRRQTAPGAQVRAVQQVPQRVRGSVRILRVGASGAAGRRGTRPCFFHRRRKSSKRPSQSFFLLSLCFNVFSHLQRQNQKR